MFKSTSITACKVFIMLRRLGKTLGSLVFSHWQGRRSDCNSDVNGRCEKVDGKYKHLMQEVWMEREEVKTQAGKGINRRL